MQWMDTVPLLHLKIDVCLFAALSVIEKYMPSVFQVHNLYVLLFSICNFLTFRK